MACWAGAKSPDCSLWQGRPRPPHRSVCAPAGNFLGPENNLRPAPAWQPSRFWPVADVIFADVVHVVEGRDVETQQRPQCSLGQLAHVGPHSQAVFLGGVEDLSVSSAVKAPRSVNTSTNCASFRLGHQWDHLVYRPARHIPALVREILRAQHARPVRLRPLFPAI